VCKKQALGQQLVAAARLQPQVLVQERQLQGQQLVAWAQAVLSWLQQQ
jgi:hypothetical protein